MGLLEKLTIQLETVTTKVTKPILCCCCRTNFFGVFYKNVYHSNEQLEFMLEQNFDGRIFKVRTRDNHKLDCMFFPQSNEKVMTLREQDILMMKLGKDNKNFKPPEYPKYPTVIFCNPNA